MDVLSSYRSNAAEAPVMRRWLAWALVLSLALHAGLFLYFRATKLERFSPYSERLVPRAFTSMGRTTIDESLLKEEKAPAPAETKKAETPTIELPKESKTFEDMLKEVRATPNTPEEIKPIASEKPKVDTTNLQQLAKLQDTTAREMEREMESVRENLLKDNVKTSKKALLEFSEKALNKTGVSGNSTGVAGYTDLDAALKQSGGLAKGTGPILMPTDLLFEFNKSELRTGAASSLQKLGRLIQKNPNVTFSIEGHTDSFGDETTNRQISLTRANAVRESLVQTMGIDPAKIETKGFGKSRMIVAPQPYDESSQASIDAEIQRQQINRRVEIVLKFAP